MNETKSLNNNKRIAKNTFVLYIRMLLIMLVTLYTSRVILKTLGEEDFGIYNIVGGIIILFSFLNGAMVVATHRFLSYEIGRGDEKSANKYFSTSLLIHVGLAVLFFLVMETIGYYLFMQYLNIPIERVEAAKWVFHFSTLSTCISVLRTPYSAVIIANEQMTFYAYISILEVIGKLIIVYLLTLFIFDKLILYSFLMFVVLCLISLIYFIYCKMKYSVCSFSFCREKERYIQLSSFSGWSLLGSMANVGANQGINILLNIFFGVVLNTAMGIANQVNAAIYNFVSSFQTAFNPQIIKSYASKDYQYFHSLLLNTSKYSFLLIWILSFPVLICCPEILKIWLGNIPEHTVDFTRLIIIFSILDAIQGPLWASVQATGKIRTYQILMSVLILANLPISYCFLLMEFSPSIVLIVRIILNVIILIVRVIYLSHLFDFPIKTYFTDVLCKCMLLIFLSFPISLIYYTYTYGWMRLFGTCFISVICTGVLAYLFVLSKKERVYIKNIVHRVI